MNRRNFFAAITPIVALAAPAFSQAPSGAEEKPAVPARKEKAPDDADADKPAPRAKGPTEIVSREAMLDNRKHLATFNGEVGVKDPEFNLSCDKLTVHLREPKAKDAAAAPAPIGADPAAAKKVKEEGSGIRLAIAEGNVGITQEKPDANGKVQKVFAKAKKAVFDNDKQTCVLTGWPQVAQAVEDGTRQILSTQESTVITLDQAGVVKAIGPNKVLLIPSEVPAAAPEKPRQP